jgi:hypothetical protein
MSLAEIRGGSSTPSMVSSVLKWKSENEQVSSQLWQDLNSCNIQFERCIRRLSELCELDPAEYNSAMDMCTKLSAKEVRTSCSISSFNPILSVVIDIACQHYDSLSFRLARNFWSREGESSVVNAL